MAVIASAMMVLFVLHAETDSSSAEIVDEGQCGPSAYYKFDSDSTLEIYGSGATYDYCYTDSPWNAYSYRITKIIIGDSITHLGEAALAGCTHAKELTLPITLNAVSSDMAHAFAGDYCFEKITFTCGKDGYGFDYAAYNGNNDWYQNTPWYQSRACLKEIVFEDGIKHIGSDAFRELKITSVVLPDTVCSLGDHCFYNCTNLTHLTIPVSLNLYGNEDYPAFEDCCAILNVTVTRGNGVPFDYDLYEAIHCTPWNVNPDIAKTVVISDDVPCLGKYMFSTCNIRGLTIPISINCAQGIPFYHIESGSLEKVTLTKGTGRGPDYDHSYGYNPWNGAPNLKSLVIEEGVTHIGNDAFRCCSMETLILPNSLYSIGEYSFKDSSVTYLTIPISLNAVWLDGNDAFNCVSGLEKVTFTPGTGYGQDYSAYDGNNCCYRHTPWYVCRGTLKEIVFEDGIKHIGSDAFRELNITSLVIPNSVESLGCHTFYNCYYLTDITVPISLDCNASSAYPAFDGCGIANVHFTAGTDGIGFDYYNNHFPPWAKFVRTPTTHLTFDSGIVYIGHDTFFGYTFYGKDGIIEPTAENLSGNSFAGMDGNMWIVNSGTERATSDHSSSDTGPILKADIITDIRRL